MNLLADIVIAAEEHELAELWLPAYWFAIIPAAIFLVMGLVTWSFRDIAHNHRSRSADRSNEAPHH